MWGSTSGSLTPREDHDFRIAEGRTPIIVVVIDLANVGDRRDVFDPNACRLS
jgi:hypothetical protein